MIFQKIQRPSQPGMTVQKILLPHLTRLQPEPERGKKRVGRLVGVVVPQLQQILKPPADQRIIADVDRPQIGAEPPAVHLHDRVIGLAVGGEVFLLMHELRRSDADHSGPGGQKGVIAKPGNAFAPGGIDQLRPPVGVFRNRLIVPVMTSVKEGNFKIHSAEELHRSSICAIITSFIHIVKSCF